MNIEEIIELKRRLDIITSELANFQLSHLNTHAGDKEILNRKLEENRVRLVADLNKEWKENIGKIQNDLDFAVKNSLSVSKELEEVRERINGLASLVLDIPSQLEERINHSEKMVRDLIDKITDKNPVKEKTRIEKVLENLFKRK